MQKPQSEFHFDISAERTAEFLLERHGASAFDLAARQIAMLYLADANTQHWRAIAMAIANKATKH